MLEPGLVPDTHLPWLLADGTEILTPAYLATVTISNFEPVVTIAIVLGDEPLLGRDVTNHFRLIFDHGHTVLVEP